MTSVVNVTLPSQRIREKSKNITNSFSTMGSNEEVKENQAKIQEKIMTKEEEDKIYEEVRDLEEKLVGKGIGNALMVFRERGMLN